MLNWDIHGLWPDFKNGSHPQFCCEQYKFDKEELKPLTTDLQKYWQDLMTGDMDNGIWFHEWNKHGTCSMANSRLNTIFKYFNTTLSLFKKYNIQQWLEEEDILPTTNKSYKLSLVINTIESKLNNKRIKIECDKYTHEEKNCNNAVYTEDGPKNCTKISSKTYKLLDSIDLCFDKNTLEPIDCPLDRSKYRKNVCDQDVYYLRLREDLDNLK